MRTDLFGDADYYDDDEDFPREIHASGTPFRSKFTGWCNMPDCDSRVRMNDLVTKVHYSDNPLIPVSGVACKSCTKWLPKGKK